ncbi:hypothetical protein SCOR_16370 [Sulfidibacter corallicola]|uniref:DUF3300 domain-containing protein n=1 Tax=Sulfidibacter corallicola TaxID=2818388 RepID=A0A8A4TY00_SULCO|nr:hypothetical protein [Sulfidibacter corallicola]QTD53964.1 hypothetical protein J3U87_16060 [Sulfidibacter corallicola]
MRRRCARFILLATAVFALGSQAFAHLSYDDLQQKLAEGVEKRKLIKEINKEGVSFDVNRKLLRQMKRDKMPDWLIDHLIVLDSRVPSHVEPGYVPPRRYGYTGHYGYGPLWWNFYSPYHHHYAWSPFWDYAYAPFGVAGLWYLGYPSYYPYRGITRVVRTLPHGHVSRQGYVSRSSDRYRGQAVRRGGNKSTASSSSRAVRSRSSGATRSSSSSSRSSSRAVRRR